MPKVNAQAIIVKNPGGPESMEYIKIALKKPAAGEVTLRHTAIGVNYIDVYHRTGLYKTALPVIPGVEACGIVEALGEGVESIKIGDRVAYGTAIGSPFGYSTHRNIDAKYLIKVPTDISDEIAATIMVKAMTAHYLLRRTFVVMPENPILIHAAAGGVGTFLCQWANTIGCKVIGTVGSEEKAQWAMENGCHYPINYKTDDWVARVLELTNGKGVPVVYDSVGKETFEKSLQCLIPMGLLVSYGQSSGPIPPFDISLLSKGSYFITRPTLATYKADRNELILSALEIFEAIRNGVLQPHITHRIPLKDAVHAHQLLEGRATMGSIVLLP